MSKHTYPTRWAGLWLALVPGIALASDFSGMFTLLVGLPSLVLANLIMGGLLAMPPSKAIRTTVSVIGIPVLLVDLLLFSDASSLFRNPGDTAAALIFFGLYALACFLFIRHMQRGAPPPTPPAPPPSPGA